MSQLILFPQPGMQAQFFSELKENSSLLHVAFRLYLLLSKSTN